MRVSLKLFANLTERLPPEARAGHRLELEVEPGATVLDVIRRQGIPETQCAIVLLDGVWVKATPAFNIELCEKFRIHALEFDGREDSIYHPYDLDGRQHMEYLAYRGEFADVPLAEMREDFRRHYPGVAESLARSDFDRDVAVETGVTG